MITSQKGALIITQPRNPFAWSSFDPVTRQKVVTVESGLGTLVPDMIHPGATCSLGPGMSSIGLTTAPTSGVLSEFAYFIPFYVTVPVTVYQLFMMNGTVVSGNVDIGIYDGDRNRIVSSGSTAQATVTQIQKFDIADTELNTGRHFLAVGFDNTTATLHRWAASNSRHAAIIGRRLLRGSGGGSFTYFPLAASVTFDAIDSAFTSADIPLIGASIMGDL